jgi:hypothetical protein
LAAALTTVGHHSGEMLLRARAILAVFGFMPTASANRLTPPNTSMTSAKELTMPISYPTYPTRSTPVVPKRWVQSEAMPRVALLPPDLATQAGRLRFARERAGFPSIRAAAQEFEWNENTYKSHEQGERGRDGIKPRHLEKYARAFAVDITWLTYGTGSPTPKPEDPVELARALLKAMGGN